MGRDHRLKLNPLDQGFIVATLAALIYVALIATGVDFTIPFALTIGGIAGMALLVNPKVDDDVTEKEGISTVKYFGLSIVGFVVAAFSSETLPQSITSQLKKLSIVDASVLTSLQAMAETIFFLGFLTAWFRQRMPEPLAITASATVFMLYHWRVYGTQGQALAYVLVAGFILAYAFLRSSGSVVPVGFAHVLNNLLAIGAISLGSFLAPHVIQGVTTLLGVLR